MESDDITDCVEDPMQGVWYQDQPGLFPDDLLNYNPPHYAKNVIQPHVFAMLNDMEFWRGQAIKYVTRAGAKVYVNDNKKDSEIADLRKAIECIQWRINRLALSDSYIGRIQDDLADIL